MLDAVAELPQGLAVTGDATKADSPSSQHRWLRLDTALAVAGLLAAVGFALPRFDPSNPDRPDYLVGRPHDKVMRRWGAEVVWEDPYRNVVIWAVPPGE